ncbi:Nif11-like leader peptide family natural product precursor [Streptomyces sp. NPDC001276]|uniref:Nif11-like leader peptide family natural product precursor n=1 Tax=Streptomyces sp. NPDC001276 TaxID=3364555 RepID=UPI0036AA222C
MSVLMDGVPSIASEVVGGLLLVVGTATAHRMAGAWKTRAERRIWRPILKNGRPLRLVLTCREGPLPRSTHRASINEVRVLLEFTPTFENIGIEYKITDSLEAPASELSSANLLILGGPAVNDVSRRTFDAIQDTLPVGISLDEVAITVANRRYAPEYGAGGQKVVKDYGLVVRCQNPFDPSHKTAAFVVMGCHGFGTAGSAQLLKNPSLAAQLAAEVDQRDFVAIAEIRVHGYEYDTRIIESFLFPRR